MLKIAFIIFKCVKTSLFEKWVLSDLFVIWSYLHEIDMFLSIEETNENALTINQSLLLLTDLAKEIGIDLEEKDNSNFRHSYGLRGTDNIFRKKTFLQI